MNEKPEVETEEARTEREQLEALLRSYETPEFPEAERRDCQSEVRELEALIDSFESEYSLEALLSITELTAEEAPKHPIREPARKALLKEGSHPIFAKLSILKEETNISKEEHDRLRARYKRLSQAVGIIDADSKVDHTR